METNNSIGYLKNDVQCTDFANICRLCLDENHFLVDIFINNNENSLPLHLRISQFSNLQISENDNLPRGICQQCLLKAETCAEFKENCIKNDNILREIIASKQQECSNDIIDIDPTKDYESSSNESDGNADIQEVEEAAPVVQNQCKTNLFFTCKYCDITFKLSEDCLRHETEEHDQLMPYSCNICEYKDTDRNILINHIREIHGIQRAYICVQCNKGFNRRNELKKHTFLHAGIHAFACEFCSKTFTRNSNLSKHVKTKHTSYTERSQSCKTCDKKFLTPSDLRRHESTHSHKIFNCSKCTQIFNRREDLSYHERICISKVYVLNPNLQLHQPPEENMVIALDPFLEIDQQMLDDENLLMAEESGSNGPEDPNKMYVCDRCPKRFATRKFLQSHYFSHLDIRNFVCEICHKAFIRKRELDRHMATHTMNKPFSCSTCLKSFSRKDKLMKHERSHYNKEFICEKCNGKFNKEEALRIHEKIHGSPTSTTVVSPIQNSTI